MHSQSSTSGPHSNTSIPMEAVAALERATLGAGILDTSGRQASILCEFVREDEWQSTLHRAVFRAIRSLLAEKSLPLEYNSVCAELIKQGVYQSYTNCVLLIVSLGEDVVLAKPMTQRIVELRRLWNARKEAEAALERA